MTGFQYRKKSLQSVFWSVWFRVKLAIELSSRGSYSSVATCSGLPAGGAVSPFQWLPTATTHTFKYWIIRYQNQSETQHVADCETNLEAPKRVIANQWSTPQQLRPLIFYTVNNSLNWPKSKWKHFERFYELCARNTVLNLDAEKWGRLGTSESTPHLGGWEDEAAVHRLVALDLHDAHARLLLDFAHRQKTFMKQKLKKKQKNKRVTFHVIFSVIHPSGSPRKCDVDGHHGVRDRRRARCCLTHLLKAEGAAGRSLRTATSQRRPRRRPASSLSGWRRWLSASPLEPRETSNGTEDTRGREILKTPPTRQSWQRERQDGLRKEEKVPFSCHVSRFVPMSSVTLDKEAFVFCISNY